MRFEWTPKADAILKSMKAAGQPNHEIARRLGTNTGVVKNRVVKLRCLLPESNRREFAAPLILAAPMPSKPLQDHSQHAPLPGSQPTDLEHVTGCRWPVGDRLFCDCRQREGSFYCATHHAIAYQPVSPGMRSAVRHTERLGRAA